MGLIFDIYKNNTLVRRDQFADKNVIKIGKLPSSDVKLDDDAVSRMHAVVEIVEDGTAQIIDLGSASGTVVRGKKVGKAWVSSGDRFTIGPYDILVFFSDANSTPLTPAEILDPPERYPEHDKLRALNGKNDVVARFMEWLRDEGYEICTLDDDRPRTYRGPRDAVFVPVNKSIEQLLSAHFKIDMKKLNDEKEAMLASVRKRS